MAGLAATATAAEQRATAERADQDRALAEATARIREEIAALEALLQEEGVNVGAEKARILAHLTATREAVARETERLRADLARLDEVVRTFSP
jgi:anti-sigma-K factor RskA